MNSSGNKILVTGGASGIGLGMAARFLQEGNTVFICGRRQSALDEAARAHPGLITHACDLSREDGRFELYEWVATTHPDLNVLVNNAGIQQWMRVTDLDFFERAKEELATNIEAPLHLTSLFLQLPSLTTIVNVTSGLAFSPLAQVPVYSATKAFFRSFTQSLRHQLKARGVEVIEAIPPALNTDLGGKGLHDAYPPVSDFIDAIFAQLKEGKNELTFGFSEAMRTAGPEQLQAAFARMNPEAK
ncbi:MAG: SDR family NAD(P)-dependent oxidoreductase [Chitinophagaceae bacterium]|nr:MAG: SDR family NAD(P)-dependent oxidoreductase [Chitinophagaceae bacterium]